MKLRYLKPTPNDRPLDVRAWVMRIGSSTVRTEPGPAWSGPIASPYGLHLVFVHKKSPERMSPLAAVRQRIIQAVMAERAAVQLARGMARLRTLREIRVEGREDLSVPARTLAAKP